MLDNTIIIFMTDHGISQARGKQFLYEEGVQRYLLWCGLRGALNPGLPAMNSLSI